MTNPATASIMKFVDRCCKRRQEPCCILKMIIVKAPMKKLLKKLVETNLEKTSGYGTDPYFCQCPGAEDWAACSCPEADVFFVSGGTQANVIVIAAMLRGYEGVVAAVTGHIHGHEAGAVEYTGHKVLALPQTDGKLSAAESEGVSGRPIMPTQITST